MKIRSGFVSNSSSSSFIIGIGVVADEDKLNELKTKAFKGSDIVVTPLVQLLADIGEQYSRWWWDSPRIKNNKIEIESFRGDIVSLDITNVDPNAKIAYVDTSGELTDDSDFYTDPDGWDLDYDLSPTVSDQTLIDVFYSDAVTSGDASGGAARNG